MALILEKDKLLESIWEYRWHILEYRMGFAITILREKQYKQTRGKHKEIQPVDIIRAKKQGLEKWILDGGFRGYKGVYKWYVSDFEDIIEGHTITPDYFNLHFSRGEDFKDYLTIHNLSYDNLVKLAFALLTYLSRNQPLKKTKYSIQKEVWETIEELQFNTLKEVSQMHLLSIKGKLKKYIEQEKISEEVGFTTFGQLYSAQEIEYIKEIEKWIWLKGNRAKTEESQTFWNKEYEKFGDMGTGECRVESAIEEAVELWQTESKNLKGRRNRNRNLFLHSIKIHLPNLSYPQK
jgi:hypothetical protein